MVAAYDDGQGNSGTFDYPPPTPCPMRPTGCFEPVRVGPDGDLVLKLTFWRPQRPWIEGDPGDTTWMNVGHLAYALGVQDSLDGTRQDTCPQSSYTQLDPALKPLPPGITLPGFMKSETAFEDLSDDQPVDPNAPGYDPFAKQNAFTAKLNLTQCYQSLGFSMPSASRPALNIQVNAVALGKTIGEPAFASSQASFALQP